MARPVRAAGGSGSKMTVSRVVVCALSELADGAAREFEFQTSEGLREGFVVRRGECLVAYRNVCPHLGNPLNWKPDAFLTRARDQIMCSVHGAVFEIETGLCVGGACLGRSLTAIPVEVVDAQVIVDPGGG